ncbi:unnamed protein product [Leptosia nina]|uniref:Gustatory receptor n=1 Tax=Leptosia nina TaxID=320188 RepID=A0AAV1K2R2_9NEOP
MDMTDPKKKYPSSLNRANEVFGVGLIGVYDFGAMSPFTMIDTTVVIFTVVTTMIAFATSLIVRSLYIAMSRCVEIKNTVTHHYMLFVMVPLSVEFMEIHKMYIIYVYLNLTVALVPGLVPINKLNGLIIGHKLSTFYLGGFKVLIVMWVYGVKKFSTDIQFLLGFKPTVYWRTVWMLLPVVLACILKARQFFSLAPVFQDETPFEVLNSRAANSELFSRNLKIFVINKINELRLLNDLQQQIFAIVWVAFSFIVVAIFQIKTIARYILHNNLMGIFRSCSKYGPLDPDDRKRRKHFDDTVLNRQCHHNCIVISENIECNHMPLIFKHQSRTSESDRNSLTDLFHDPSGTKKRVSSVVDATYNYN